VQLAGIDRWRGGWVVAQQRCHHHEIWTADHLCAAMERLAVCRCVAIDMPIALAVSGTRSAESQLRAVLGSAARSVFTSPTRDAVEAADQAGATRTNRANGGPGISAQSFGLFASIRELRAALAGTGATHWWETHPETAFALMNGNTPLASKRSALGVAQRLRALRAHFPGLDDLLLESPPRVPIDDILDAFAALWSAQRIATDRATLFGPGDRDDEGFAIGVRV
jgi:predicted RNase H-like nuclease